MSLCYLKWCQPQSQYRGTETHEIFMRFENAVTTDSNLSVCLSRLRHLSVWLLRLLRPAEEKLNETSWKLQHQAHVKVCLPWISQPANCFYWVLQGNNKELPNLYANLLFLLIVSSTKFTCFCQRCFHLSQKWNSTADLLVTQDRLWKQEHPTDCKIKQQKQLFLLGGFFCVFFLKSWWLLD